MDDGAEFQYLKIKRGYVRAKITKYVNTLSSQAESWNIKHCENAIDDLNNLKENISNANSEISNIIWKFISDENEFEEESEKCDYYNGLIVSGLRAMRDKIETLRNDEQPFPFLASYNDSVSNTPRASQLKLPNIPLPVYSHSLGESYEKFITNFELIVNKYSLSSYEKFIYLEGQLRGEPLTLIRSLQGSEQSYFAAKKLLEKAFASQIDQKFEVIGKLSNLTLKNNGSCYEFISDVNLINHSFTNLNITVKDVLQYFTWKAMPQNLQCQFVNITNKTKPSFDEIRDNIFSAIERFKCFKISEKPVKTVGFAVNVDGIPEPKNSNPTGKSKFKPCILCSDKDIVDHAINKCTAYVSPSDKISKLKSLNACLKCGYDNHTTNKCLFKFHKKCINCSGDHFSYLCNNAQRSKEKSKNSNVTNGSIGIECSIANNSSLSCNTILPTFTTMLQSGHVLRCLKDTGAQYSFIKESVALREKLNIIKEVNVTVEGFNSSRPYRSKVVRLPLKFGQKWYFIKALTIPNIKTSMKLPGLQKVVSKFVSLGYDLADKRLLDAGDESISDISFILGANAAHRVMEKYVNFGKSRENFYIDSNIGVLLIGDIHKIEYSIKHLP